MKTNSHRATRGRFGWAAALAGGAATMLAIAATPVASQVADPDAVPPPVIQPALTRVPMPPLSEAQAKQLRQMLEGASAHGLSADAGRAPVQPVGLGAGDPALVDAVMDYARALHAGRLANADYLPAWGLRPAAYDPRPGFIAAVEKDRVASWIAALPPPYAGYDALRRGLTAYRKIETDGGWPTIPAGPDMGLGATGPRVVALRKRLAAEDGESAGASEKYDVALGERVRRAQKRYGLEPTGMLGPQTLAALNVPVAQRVRQIVANMERWRWLPAELPADRIQVNIAAAVLTMFKGDAPVTSMRAVTGRPGDETPMLQSQIHSIVINPPWNVPQSIAKKELLPKGAKYLARNGFKTIPLDGGGSRLQQKPGEGNSLGRIKFDFDNPYGVYLHDTSSRGAFSRYARLVSHGCVRLERPVDLAELVMRGDDKWQ
ncbi:MAG: L,D-transpeptidase family protein, partial [Sphingomonas sp.]